MAVVTFPLATLRYERQIAKKSVNSNRATLPLAASSMGMRTETRYLMADRRIDVFFYGLFMDSDILSESQVAAVRPLRAFVHGYGLRIGRRATLVPASGARAYGMVFALTHDELERLYATPGLEQYRPEAVVAHSLEGESLPALCYNLREAPGPGEANAEYAARLRSALGKLDFPPEYIASVS